MEIMNQVEKEMNTAYEKYGHFASSHEVYGVLKEEVDEFWDEVKNDKEIKSVYNSDKIAHKQTRAERMISELTQIAAVALRAAKELEENKIKFV